MSRPACTFLVILAVLTSACGGSMKTGTVARPDASDQGTSPNEGTCPNDYTLCGTGDSAVCVDLREDPKHCGACGKACPKGVACASGLCQREVCQGRPILSAVPSARIPSLDSTFGGIVLADVNGDGLLDLVVWYSEGTSDPDAGVKRAGPGRFSISLGQIGGGFGAAQDYATEAFIRRVQVADINHDGADDLFILEIMSPCRELWLGHEDGLLTRSPELPVTGCDWALAVGDVSGDGHHDVVVASPAKDGLDVYLSDGAGGLQFSRLYGAPSWSVDIVIQDWNGDGFPDLVVVGSSLLIFTNRGDGTFDDAQDCGLAVGIDILVSDFNHDGHQDFAMKQSYGLAVWLGQGGCRFAPAAPYEVTKGCDVLKSADMDGDGQLDLLCMNIYGLFTGLLGNPDGSFQAAASFSLNGTAGLLNGIAIGDVTGDGRPDLVVANRHGPESIWENTCR